MAGFKFVLIFLNLHNHVYVYDYVETGLRRNECIMKSIEFNERSEGMRVAACLPVHNEKRGARGEQLIQ